MAWRQIGKFTQYHPVTCTLGINDNEGELRSFDIQISDLIGSGITWQELEGASRLAWNVNSTNYQKIPPWMHEDVVEGTITFIVNSKIHHCKIADVNEDTLKSLGLDEFSITSALAYLHSTNTPNTI